MANDEHVKLFRETQNLNGREGYELLDAKLYLQEHRFLVVVYNFFWVKWFFPKGDKRIHAINTCFAWKIPGLIGVGLLLLSPSIIATGLAYQANKHADRANDLIDTQNAEFKRQNDQLISQTELIREQFENDTKVKVLEHLYAWESKPRTFLSIFRPQGDSEDTRERRLWAPGKYLPIIRAQALSRYLIICAEDGFVNLSNAKLNGIEVADLEFKNAMFEHSNLEDAMWRECIFKKTSVTGFVRTSNVDFEDCKFFDSECEIDHTIRYARCTFDASAMTWEPWDDRDSGDFVTPNGFADGCEFRNGCSISIGSASFFRSSFKDSALYSEEPFVKDESPRQRFSGCDFRGALVSESVCLILDKESENKFFEFWKKTPVPSNDERIARLRKDSGFRSTEKFFALSLRDGLEAKSDSYGIFRIKED